jgi:copper chaperone CopZ
LQTCWEIRAAGQLCGGAGERRIPCTDCAFFHAGGSCWDGKRDAVASCCCAPLHLTCDFCALYIEHRRELAGLLAPRLDLVPPPASQAISGGVSYAGNFQGGIIHMEKVQFNVPALWADHHVLQVREVLAATPGVEDVVASSAFRMVALAYDPGVTSADHVAGVLAEAGYPIAADDKGIVAQPISVADARMKDPAWDRLGVRVVRTDPRDAKQAR